MTEQELLEIKAEVENSAIPKPSQEKILEACEKQVSRKTNLSGDGYYDGHLVYDEYQCPNCGKIYELDYEEYEHCPNCGQKMLIDRSDKDADVTD